MKRRPLPTFFFGLSFVLASWLVPPLAGSARADEEDDIQRQIETQKAGANDLEKLDARRAATPELQRLRDWLAEAWDLRNKHEADASREVLDRCLAQADLIRQLITANQARADLTDKEKQLQKTRDKIAQQRKALQEAQTQKRILEPKVAS